MCHNNTCRGNISLLLLKQLLFIYNSQTLCVRCGHSLLKLFPVENGVKQGGVLYPLLFKVYTKELLTNLQITDFGCHISWCSVER